MQTVRVRAGWRAAGLVLGMLGTACLLRSSSAAGWIQGAFAPAAASRAAPVMADKGELAPQTYVEGETNLWGSPLSDETKGNFAKADQIRKDFDMRNNKDTWYGPMADRPGSETRDEKAAAKYESRSQLYGAQDANLAKAAQIRADFMVRNGKTEWLDVMSNTRLDELGPGGAPAVSAAAPSEASPALTANQQAAYQ